jgi:type I restriction enzyme S subunit
MNKGYEKYKNTGVEWIGKIPEHWEHVKLKWISNIYAGGTPSTSIGRFWENGTIPWLNSGTVNQNRITEPSSYITEEAVEKSSTKWVTKGAVLIALAGQGKTKGTVAILDIDATCNQSMGAIVPENKIYNEFLYYWLHSNYQRIRGLAGSDLRDGLNLEIIGNIFCPLPDLSEQKKIAAFLTLKITKIDLIIHHKEVLINKFQEYRQSVINEAITKGLDPDVPLKDSGIEWLGKIPENWKTSHLRHLNKKIGSGVTPKGGNEVYTEQGVIFIRSQNVHFDGLILDDVARIDLETHRKMSSTRTFYKDILLNITGASIGRCCVVNTKEEMNVNQHVCIIRPNDKLNSDFLNLVLQSNIGQSQIRFSITGGNREGLTFEAVKDFIIPIPDMNTQILIVDEIERKISRIIKLFDTIQLQIDKLKEYRQSLISEAVTGKIDVRDWKPPVN